MNRIFLNLKRFDISPTNGGVNHIAPIRQWGKYIVSTTQKALETYPDAQFVMFFPEAHLLEAVGALDAESRIKIGCQSVHREDTAQGGNFGAFTTNRTANAVKELGCEAVLIGHCEERRDKQGILLEAGVTDTDAINRILNRQIKCATKAGLQVLYCIGETAEEQANWQETLHKQLDIGLAQVDMQNICIAYEPVWAIGPGKTPPNAEYIQKIARYIKEVTGGASVVYGGGLKVENARDIAQIPEIDGGLIALTRFSGEIGFYPEEYLQIIDTFFGDEQSK